MFWPTLATFLFPGFAQALVHRRLRAALWLAGATLLIAASTQTIWAALLVTPLHLAAAIDGWLCMRRDSRPGRNDRAAAAVLLVLGAITTGLSQAAIEASRVASSSSYPTVQIGDHILVNKLAHVERGDLIELRYPCNERVSYVKRIAAIAGDTVEVRCGTVYVNGTAAADTLGDGSASYFDYDQDRDAWNETATQVAASRETIGGHSFGIFHARDAERRAIGDFPQDDQPPSCENITDRSAVPQTLGLIAGSPDDPAKPCVPHRHYVVPPGHVFVLGDNRENSNDSRRWGSLPLDHVVGRVIGIWWSRGHDGVDLRRIGRVD
ncbi:MAG TPA: signal peptidase I [Kofleriaceae bacterium]|jgi:signal peptidase I